MTTVIDAAEKVIGSELEGGFGYITIRVVVLKKKEEAAAAATVEEEPADVEPDEILPETDKRPVSGFLEEPKRGKWVCVFLINGQRQHAWDNQFIVRDLEMKYLRTRMLVVVDCDGLKPEAIAELMQGSRHQFYEGRVYAALEARVLAALKNDPDLIRLEEEAEDEISSLQAGDEAVKATLDQLIQSHHEAADHLHHGHTQAGSNTRDKNLSGGLSVSEDVVSEETPPLGEAAHGPILRLRPDVASIRLHPNEPKRLAIQPAPETAWSEVESFLVTVDPPIKELQLVRATQVTGEEITLTFVEPEDFEDDEYPIESVLTVIGSFKGAPEPRILERRVVITPKPDRPNPQPPKPLLEDPTLLKVTSRRPIKLMVGGPDLHVKLRWDGKDELLTGQPPQWSHRVTCDSPSVEPPVFLTRPTNGRFELLIQSVPGLSVGEKLKFDVEAIGPGKTLATSLLVEVATPDEPRRLTKKIQLGGQRRPPYDLVYVTRDKWASSSADCFGEPWSGDRAGSYEPPSPKSPLRIFINPDTDLLTTYRDELVSRKLAEATIQQRVTRYTAHVAFHLYQMYERSKKPVGDDGGDSPSDASQRDEIERVARTLIRLMEVTG